MSNAIINILVSMSSTVLIEFEEQCSMELLCVLQVWVTVFDFAFSEIITWSGLE